MSSATCLILARQRPRRRNPRVRRANHMSRRRRNIRRPESISIRMIWTRATTLRGENAILSPPTTRTTSSQWWHRRCGMRRATRHLKRSTNGRLAAGRYFQWCWSSSRGWWRRHTGNGPRLRSSTAILDRSRKARPAKKRRQCDPNSRGGFGGSKTGYKRPARRPWATKPHPPWHSA